MKTLDSYLYRFILKVILLNGKEDIFIGIKVK